MKIILASGNSGKIKEIKELMGGFEVLPFSDLLGKFEIIENGKTFKENALIKAKAVFEKLHDKDNIVIADDSGISVPALGGIPGIYSARFAKVGASDKENLFKLIDELKKNDIKSTPAYYTAAIAIITPCGEFSVHGWMHGCVIDEARGEGGFGYDPMFIPAGFDKTLGELDGDVKEKFSHRSKALRLAKVILNQISH